MAISDIKEGNPGSKTQDRNGAGKVQGPEGRNGKGSKTIREEMALKNKKTVDG